MQLPESFTLSFKIIASTLLFLAFQTSFSFLKFHMHQEPTLLKLHIITYTHKHDMVNCTTNNYQMTAEKKNSHTVVPEILSRVLHKDSQGRDAKILDLWVGNQSCKKVSHPPQPLQKHSRCCRILSSPPFLLKKHSHMSHNHPLTTLFKMTCAKQIPTCCKTILIQALSHLPCFSPIVVFLLMISCHHI